MGAVGSYYVVLAPYDWPLIGRMVVIMFGPVLAGSFSRQIFFKFIYTPHLVIWIGVFNPLIV